MGPIFFLLLLHWLAKEQNLIIWWLDDSNLLLSVRRYNAVKLTQLSNNESKFKMQMKESPNFECSNLRHFCDLREKANIVNEKGRCLSI